jgi:hypothetical protein
MAHQEVDNGDRNTLEAKVDSLPGRSSARSNLRSTLLVILSIAIALAILVGLALMALSVLSPDQPELVDPPTHTPPPTFTQIPTSTPLPTLTVTPSPTPSPTPTPIVVNWRELGHLAVDQYKARTVVEVTRSSFWGTDRILLEAVGNIQVGIDMKAIRPSDVEIEGTSVRITLPRAQVTAVEILPAESRVYDSRRKWLFSEYEGIEVEAMDRARDELWQWAANEESMLRRSESLARLQLAEFLRKLGFREIEIDFRE